MTFGDTLFLISVLIGLALIGLGGLWVAGWFVVGVVAGSAVVNIILKVRDRSR